MKVVKKLSKNTLFGKKEVLKLGERYLEISEQIKVLDTEKKELLDKIKQGAESFGVQDDKGSFYLEDDTFILGKVARKFVSINQATMVNYLANAGFNDLIRVEEVRTVDEQALERAVTEGRLSLDDIQEFMEVKTSYSGLVKRKEEMPDVEQSTLKAAKRR